MLRLFVAVEPPPDVQEALSELRSDIPGAKWVPREQLHLTLRFVGEVPEERLPALREALSGVARPRFEVAIRGLGSFGRPAKVLWAGLEPIAPLEALADDVDGAVRAAGLPDKDKPFKAHVTLARLKQASPAKVEALLAAHEHLALPPFEVDRFHLFRSELGPKGATHTVDTTVPLEPPAGR